jgi:hypothetical protein
MKLTKVELYVWGFNDEKDVDPLEALPEIRNTARRDIALVIGETRTATLPDPEDDDYPLNLKDQNLKFCRDVFGNKGL